MSDLDRLRELQQDTDAILGDISVFVGVAYVLSGAGFVWFSFWLLGVVT